MHFELERRLDADALELLADDLRRVLADVRSAVADFPTMLVRLEGMIDVAREAAAPLRPGRGRGDNRLPRPGSARTTSSSSAIASTRSKARPTGRRSHVVAGSGLGILRDEARRASRAASASTTVDPALRQRIEAGELLIVSKTNRVSPVHRRARMDYIGLKRVSPEGVVVGELRILGLFTSKAYMEPGTPSADRPAEAAAGPRRRGSRARITRLQGRGRRCSRTSR